MKKFLLFSLLSVFAISMYAQTIVFEVLTPSNFAGFYEFSNAEGASGWGCPDMTIDTNSIQGELAFVAPGVEADRTACNPLADPSLVAGKIAVLYRGGCEFGVKALNAQEAGAIGVIIINNEAEGTITMGGGAQGGNVTIPVWMVSRPTAEPFISAIESGEMTAFYGAKVLDFDLAIPAITANFPPSAARPRAISQNQDEFGFDPGFTIVNNGVNNQSGITASVTITNNGNVVAEESVSDLSVDSGDSLFVAFAPYYPSSFDVGTYQMTYNVTSTSGDQYDADNVLQTQVEITDNMFAYHPVVTGTTDLDVYGAIRGVDSQEYSSCIQFRDANASRLALNSISFYASGATGFDLTGEYIELEVYEWYDGAEHPNTDVDAPYDEFSFIGFGEYTFEGDDQYVLVNQPLDEPIELADNMRYVVCVKSSTAEVYLGNYYVGDLDYTRNINEVYLEPTDIVGIDGRYLFSGFGADRNNGVGLHFDLINNVSEVKETFESEAYPNPAMDHVVMPINISGATAATVEVFDLAGKKVKSIEGNILESRGVKINTTDLNAGTYMFQITTNTGLTANTKVVIVK